MAGYRNTAISEKPASLLGKPLREASKRDIIELVGKIESNEEWTAWTKQDFKVILRRFFKWLKTERGYLEGVRCVRTTMKKSRRRCQSRSS